MRRRLLVTILATTLLGSVAAAEEPADSLPEPICEAHQVAPSVLQCAGPASPQADVTVSCSAMVPSGVGGCWVERPMFTLGPVEFALGVDAQGDGSHILAGDFAAFFDTAHLAPYGILAYYGDTTSFWAELRLPEFAGVPVLGSPDWLRVGFTYRFPP